MRIVGYTSERLAAACCLRCAYKRWSIDALARGNETTYHAGETANVRRTYNLHPIFSTDEIDDLTCDDCFDPIGS